jgi:hypothetical protein
VPFFVERLHWSCHRNVVALVEASNLVLGQGSLWERIGRNCGKRLDRPAILIHVDWRRREYGIADEGVDFGQPNLALHQQPDPLVFGDIMIGRAATFLMVVSAWAMCEVNIVAW